MKLQKHAPGSFCWVELGSKDQEGSRKFYHELFGWGSSDTPIGPDNNYTIFKKDGHDVAALYQLQKEQLERGVSSRWMLYISSSDVDASVAAVTEAGGTVVMGPFDVMEEGRMAIAQDPVGATFSIWQPKKTIGVTVINEDNAMCWQELATTDLKASEKFYASVFGWTVKWQGKDDNAYVEFYVGEPSEKKTAGGMLAIKKEWGNVPPNWMVYYSVNDCDASATKAESVGGKIIMAPDDIPHVGRFSVLQDPQGAVFSIIRLDQM